MMQCTQCGRENADRTQFCRFCGTRLEAFDGFPQQHASDYQFAPPRPYAWKTDEYQTQSERRVRNVPETGPLYSSGTQYPLAQPFYGGNRYIAANYICPNCGTTALPITERRISSAGWMTFALLLVFTVVFFWIGLLMKENVSVCPVCRATLS